MQQIIWWKILALYTGNTITSNYLLSLTNYHYKCKEIEIVALSDMTYLWIIWSIRCRHFLVYLEAGAVIPFTCIYYVGNMAWNKKVFWKVPDVWCYNVWHVATDVVMFQFNNAYHPLVCHFSCLECVVAPFWGKLWNISSQSEIDQSCIDLNVVRRWPIFFKL